MYVVLRLIVGIALALILTKTKVLKCIAGSKKRIWILAVAVITPILLYFLPMENAFTSFDSPETAFRYVYSYEAKGSAEGMETTFVVGEKKGASVYAIVPKTETGWKLDPGHQMKLDNSIFVDGMLISVYRHDKTNESYAVVSSDLEMLQICDVYGNIFHRIASNQSYIYCAYVPEYNGEYKLSVNGNDYLLSSEEFAIG